jgi:peptidoglycan-associated lipoprotein
MARKAVKHSTLILVIFGLFITLTVSCAKKTVKTQTSRTGPTQTETTNEGLEQPVVQEQKAQKEEPGVKEEVAAQRTPAAEAPPEERRREMEPGLEEERRRAEAEKLAAAAREKFLNELVLFDFDSSILTQTAQERLKRKAEWLRDNPRVKIVIEGHCDERGTNEYNLALGERRSMAARNFLVDMGIAASRITTVSYGEERPFAAGHDEAAWRLNRRAHFVIN